MKTPKTPEDYTTLIGIDWGHSENAICVLREGVTKPQECILKALPEVLHPWAANIQRAHAENTKIAVAIERLDIMAVRILEQYDVFDIYQINPAAVAMYRKSFAVANPKDDRRDAHILAQMLRTHLASAKAHIRDSEQNRKLEKLTIYRRNQIGERQALEKRLASILRITHPVILEIFSTGDLSRPVVTTMLQRWPTLGKLLAARPATITKFLYQHNVRSGKRVDEILAKFQQAVPVLEDPVELDCYTMQIEQLIDHITVYARNFKKIEQEIKTVWNTHPARSFFQEFPGAGVALAPRLAVLFGEHRERWSSAEDLLSATGIAPVRRASGKSMVVCFRHAASKFSRQTLHEFARCSIGSCSWAKAFYEMKKKAGKSHNEAVRALAYKWGRIMFVCWKNNTPYDELKHLESLIKKNSPIIAHMSKACE